MPVEHQPDRLDQLGGPQADAAGDELAGRLDGCVWAAAGFAETEKHYRRMMGYKQLWILKALLDEPVIEQQVAKKRKAG